MVAPLTSLYRRDEPLPIEGICARYRGRLGRARWGQNNGSVAQPTEYFRDGSRDIRTFPGKDWAIRHRTSALRSPDRHFWLGLHVVDVMQPVCYSPCSLAFTFILYRSSRARRACCCSTFNSESPCLLL